MNDEQIDTAKTLMDLFDAGGKGFITSTSCGQSQKYEVKAKFRSIEDMHDFYNSLVNCFLRGRALKGDGT